MNNCNQIVSVNSFTPTLANALVARMFQVLTPAI